MSGFTDRTEAGRRLADLLAAKGYADPVILALPRGGVPVGLEIARVLKAPLDLVMVRKLGVPFQPELAAGAVVNGSDPEIVTNEAVMAHAGLSRKDLEEMAEVQLEEIRRRRAVYLRGRQQAPVRGRTAIIVDDGIATGATVRAAIRGVRQKSPAKLVLAVPVAPVDTIERLRAEVDEIVCPETPEFFYAIGAHYVDFRQLEDAEVVRMLDEASRPGAGEAEGAKDPG